MVPAMKAALADPRPADGAFVRQVVFLTDGADRQRAAALRHDRRGRGRSRIFMVGIGSAPNTFLMTRAAELGRGTFTHIGSAEQVEERMAALFEKLESPPRPAFPRLLGGRGGHDALAAAGSLSRRADGRSRPGSTSSRATSRSRARSASGPGRSPCRSTGAARAQGLSKLWARRKIADAEVGRDDAAS